MSVSVARMLTPPQVGRQLGVTPEKVIGWIRRGELRAANLATTLKGRPRYRIAPDDLDSFLVRRTVAPPTPRATRRKRWDTSKIIQYF